MRRCVGITVDMVESTFWLAERFTKAQAWIDLIMMANYKDHDGVSGAKTRRYRRGCVYMSNLAMRKRFQWSDTRLKNFLAELQNSGKIKISGAGSRREIEIVDYNELTGFVDGYSSYYKSRAESIMQASDERCEDEIAQSDKTDEQQETEDFTWFDRL